MIPLYLVYSLAYLPILISYAYDNRVFVMSYIEQIPPVLYIPLAALGYPLIMLIALVYSGIYYHLWYFIGLFFSIIIVTAFYIIRWEKILAVGTIVLYVLGVLGCAYYKVGIMIPGISVIINSSHFES